MDTRNDTLHNNDTLHDTTSTSMSDCWLALHLLPFVPGDEGEGARDSSRHGGRYAAGLIAANTRLTKPSK